MVFLGTMMQLQVLRTINLSNAQRACCFKCLNCYTCRHSLYAGLSQGHYCSADILYRFSSKKQFLLSSL